MKVSDTIFESACEWGFVPSGEMVQAWPDFDFIVLTDADREGMANALQAAIHRGETEAMVFAAVIPLLRRNGVVLEDVRDAFGTPTDEVRFTFPS